MFTIGADLGQSQDYTALTVLETVIIDGNIPPLFTNPNKPFDKKPEPDHFFALRHLERLSLGTPYPAQVSRITELYNSVLRMGKATMIVDGTGVGRAVVDLLRDRGLSFVPVQITGGNAESSNGIYLSIPKRDLVASVQVLLQSGKLKISSGLELSETLTKELLGFKVTFNKNNHDSYGNDSLSWRDAPHDDLVLATALACWQAEKMVNPPKPSKSSQGVGNFQYVK